ncbi:MAG: Gene Transfer Agent terminase protein, partial [uncultured Sphingomonas sp.]
EGAYRAAAPAGARAGGGADEGLVRPVPGRCSCLYLRVGLAGAGEAERTAGRLAGMAAAGGARVRENTHRCRVGAAARPRPSAGADRAGRSNGGGCRPGDGLGRKRGHRLLPAQRGAEVGPLARGAVLPLRSGGAGLFGGARRWAAGSAAPLRLGRRTVQMARRGSDLGQSDAGHAAGGPATGAGDHHSRQGQAVETDQSGAGDRPAAWTDARQSSSAAGVPGCGRGGLSGKPAGAAGAGRGRAGGSGRRAVDPRPAGAMPVGAAAVGLHAGSGRGRSPGQHHGRCVRDRDLRAGRRRARRGAGRCELFGRAAERVGAQGGGRGGQLGRRAGGGGSQQWRRHGQRGAALGGADAGREAGARQPRQGRSGGAGGGAVRDRQVRVGGHVPGTGGRADGLYGGRLCRGWLAGPGGRHGLGADGVDADHQRGAAAALAL